VSGIVITLAACALILTGRIKSALLAYLAFSAGALVLSFPHGAHAAGLALFGLLASAKLVAGPLVLVWLVRTHGAPEDLAPAMSVAWRVVFAVAAVAIGRAAGELSGFAHSPHAGTVFTAFFCSVAIVIVHRNLLAHVLGLLALGSAVSLAGAVFGEGLSGAIELGDTFDILLATLVALALARAIVIHNPRLDVRRMRELRG
jgi:hydrogenase-4 membrane subunit HyfE